MDLGCWISSSSSFSLQNLYSKICQCFHRNRIMTAIRHAIMVTHLSLQSDGIEGLVSLDNSDEQADPRRGAEGAAHLGHESDAAYEAQCTPAPVLLPRHQPVGVTA